ncbi:MAG: insulinase family protein, partial [Pseudomonadota bacterium]
EKRGLCYSIYAYHWSISDAGFFGIYAATDADHMADLCAVIDETLARSAKDVSDAEVARARAQIKAGLLMSLESPSSRIEQIARQCAVFGRVMTSEELAAHVDAVTPEKVRALAGRLVASRNPAIAAVGPESGLAVLRTMSDQAAGG